MTYEDQTKRLDEILQSLSNNSTPLDEAIKLFEEGKEICSNLDKILNEVQAKITTITEDGSEKEAK